MFKFVILLSIVACAFGAAIPEGLSDQLDGRIVGGSPTTINNYPYIVSLQRSGAHSCGGVIYSNTFVVTAAHCLQQVAASVLSIRAGSTYWNSGGVSIPVADFKNHEGYNVWNMMNDIAVIRLSTALTYSSTIQPIGLATQTPSNGAAAVISGWGTTAYGSSTIPSQLQMAAVNVISLASCASNTYGYGSLVSTTMICANGPGRDACQLDSGGPLVTDGVVAGIVSWGNGCANANFPGVYADVAVLRPWILNTIESM